MTVVFLLIIKSTLKPTGTRDLDGVRTQTTSISSLSSIPSGWRQLTAPEAMIHKDTILHSIGTSDIIVLAGGKISGSALGGSVTVGYFDKGLGLTWLVKSVSDFRIRLMWISSFDDIPDGWRLLTPKEAEDRRDEIRNGIGKWAICKFAGGKISGNGYGGKIQYGIYGKMLGNVLVVPLYAGAPESKSFKSS